MKANDRQTSAPTSPASRLARLRARRRGLDRPDVVPDARRRTIIARKAEREAWEEQELPDRVAYCVGAMEEVAPAETQSMVEAVEMVGNGIARHLLAMGKPTDFRVQGSVPANTHIRLVSDVDLLVITQEFTSHDLFSLRALLGVGWSQPPDASRQFLGRLRRALEAVLSQEGRQTDLSGAKAVRVHGGELPCPVDVVAAHWHDTPEFDRSGQEIDREVVVLDRREMRTIQGAPFRLIERLAVRDAESRGGLKRAIRLCKNLKADATAEGREVGLSSYEISAALYHLEPGALSQGADPYLAALEGARAWFKHLADDGVLADGLGAPEAPRRLLASSGRRIGVAALAHELERLAADVRAELGVEDGPIKRGLRGARL